MIWSKPLLFYLMGSSRFPMHPNQERSMVPSQGIQFDYERLQAEVFVRSARLKRSPLEKIKQVEQAAIPKKGKGKKRVYLQEREGYSENSPTTLVAENQIQKYHYIIDTIPKETDKTCLRDVLVSTFDDLELCKGERDECTKKFNDIKDQELFQQLIKAKEDLLASEKQIGNLKEQIGNLKEQIGDVKAASEKQIGDVKAASEKQIGDVKAASEKQIGDLNIQISNLKNDLANTTAILKKRTVSMRALIIRTCEEYIEKGVFPIWLQELSITRKEKWILAISCLETQFAADVRKLINSTYDEFDIGVAVIATGMDSIYKDISTKFAHPTAPEDVVIPTEEFEIEELCKTASLTNDEETKTVCKLIFKIRNILAAATNLFSGKIPVNHRANAIFYGIIRRTHSRSFESVKPALDLIPTEFAECKIKSNIFFNTEKNAPGETKTDAIITFKATCPKTTIFNDFRERTKTLLEPFLNTKTSETDLRIIEEPFCRGKL